MKRVRRWLVLVLVAASGAACDMPTTRDACDGAQVPDIREPMVIVIGEEYEHRIDMVEGDRLDVRMTPDGGQLDRCEHMGGELVADPVRGLWTCEEVDH